MTVESFTKVVPAIYRGRWRSALLTAEVYERDHPSAAVISARPYGVHEIELTLVERQYRKERT